MKQLKILTIDEDNAKLFQSLLETSEAHSEYGTDETIKTFTVKFDESIEADIKICNSDSGPYIDAILFDNGCEVNVLEPNYTLLGEYEFEYNDQLYKVRIQT